VTLRCTLGHPLPKESLKYGKINLYSRRLLIGPSFIFGGESLKAKQHVVPCKECPFRRISMPGWLGENDPVNFVLFALAELRMPCHKKWSAQCAGRSTMWTNSCKVPRDPSLLQIETPDRINVFSNIMEFMKHHGISVERVRTVMCGDSNG
jgi:hypothetical protein